MFSYQAAKVAATADIFALDVPDALGGIIGGAVVDSSFGAGAIPFFAAIVPTIGLAFIVRQERRHPSTSVTATDARAQPA